MDQKHMMQTEADFMHLISIAMTTSSFQDRCFSGVLPELLQLLNDRPEGTTVVKLREYPARQKCIRNSVLVDRNCHLSGSGSCLSINCYPVNLLLHFCTHTSLQLIISAGRQDNNNYHSGNVNLIQERIRSSVPSKFCMNIMPKGENLRIAQSLKFVLKNA